MQPRKISFAAVHINYGGKIMTRTKLKDRILPAYTRKEEVFNMATHIVGGGFGVGVHNLLEAAVYGMPVFFGPNNRKFREAAKLKECGGGLEITCYDDFKQKMDRLSSDEAELAKAGAAAGKYVNGNSGATQKMLCALKML